MAANYNHEYVCLHQWSLCAHYQNFSEWRNSMVVPPETFAGKDLLQLEIEGFEESTSTRKSLKAKFFPSASKVTISTGPQDEQAAPTAGSEAVAPTVANTEASDSSGVLVLAENDGNDGTTVAVVVEKKDEEDSTEHTDSTPALSAGSEKKDGTGEGDDIASPISPGGVIPSSETLQALLSGGGLTIPQPQPENPLAQGQPRPVVIDASRLDVHIGFSCDGCGKPVIVGIRWKCLVCENYDLCDDCHGSGRATERHNNQHRVLRIETRDGG